MFNARSSMDSYPSSLFEDLTSLQYPSLEQVLPPNRIPTTATSDLDFLALPNIIPDIGNTLTSTLSTYPQNPLLSIVPSHLSTIITTSAEDSESRQHKVESSEYEDARRTDSSEEISCSTASHPATTHTASSPDRKNKRSNSTKGVSKKAGAGVVKSRSNSKHPKPSNFSRQSSVIDLKHATSQITSPSNLGDDNDEDDDALLAAETSIATRPDRGNISHTRRCRAKVNNSFERLMNVLPQPPTGVDVKHKAQILAYAIDTYRDIRCRNTQLEMRLALSSRQHLHKWVYSVASSSRTLTDALKPFMSLICMTKNWKYAELWAPSENSDSERTSLKYVVGALPPTVQGDELHRLKAYRYYSRRFVFRPRSGVPGRVYLTRRPEWLPVLSDPVAFPRAPHAVDNKVEVTFAVPVIVNGSVRMVVEFYDTESRDYDHDTINVSTEVTELLGRLFSAQRP